MVMLVDVVPAAATASSRGVTRAARLPAAIVASDDLIVDLSQASVSYDPGTNRSLVSVTVTPTGAAAPWTWVVAVRGGVVASGIDLGPGGHHHCHERLLGHDDERDRARD